MSYRFSVHTKSRTDFINITPNVTDVLSTTGITDGLCTIYVPHTTAGITINENADPDVKTDIIKTLEGMVPWMNNYKHFEGNSAAHIKASLIGFSVTVPVENGKLAFGTWQCLYFCEFDGPRTRKVVVTVTGT